MTANRISRSSAAKRKGDEEGRGAARWAIRLGGTKAESGRAVAVGPDGYLTVTGLFRDEVDFGGTRFTARGADGFVKNSLERALLDLERPQSAAIGALIRNQTVALLVPPVWMLLVETLLPAYGLHRFVPFTPGGISSALAGADIAGALPVWAAVLVLLGYGLAMSVAAVRRTEQSDVS